MRALSVFCFCTSVMILLVRAVADPTTSLIFSSASGGGLLVAIVWMWVSGKDLDRELGLR